MFRCLPDFGLCFNYMYDQSSSDGIFIFHGFPSQKNRNKDLAHFLSEHTHANVFVIHHEGLGESLGKFYFERTLPTAEKFVEARTKEFGLKRLHFLGHSWGGFISLNLLPHFKNSLESLVLFSPFTQIPDNKGIAELSDSLMKEYPHFFFHRTHADVCDEFALIQKKYNYLPKLSSLQWQKPSLVLQAKNDAITPENKTQAVLPLLGSKTQYTELPIDHSFTQNREDTFALILQFYKDIQITK